MDVHVTVRLVCVCVCACTNKRNQLSSLTSAPVIAHHMNMSTKTRVHDQEIDSHRFRDAIRAAIGDETSGIEEYKMFTKWAAKVDKTPVPSQDPLKPSKKKKKTKSGGGDGSDTSALALAILGNRKKRQDDFMSRLEAKYGGVGKSSAAGLGVGGQSMKKKKSKKK